MKKKFITLMLAVTMTVTCVACGNKTSSSKADTSSTKATENLSVTETEEEVKTQDIKSEELTAFSDKGIITGVKNITVEQGTDVKLNELVYADKTIVKSVDIDDSKADYSKAGTYDVIYTITFNGDKLRDCIKDNKMKVSFDTEGDTVVVKTTVKITVATKEETEAAISKGDTSVVTEETKETVKKENKAKANDNAVASKTSETAKNNNNSSKKNDNRSGNSNGGNSSANSGNSGNHNGNSGNNGNTNNGNHNGNTNGNGNSNGSGNNGSTDKPQQHTHNYVEVSRTNATCTAAGSITKKCDCGDVITVPNGDALGHDPVTETVTAAWTENVYDEMYVCNDCGQQFATNKDALLHTKASADCHTYYLDEVVVNTINHPAVTRTVCSRCGQQL